MNLFTAAGVTVKVTPKGRAALRAPLDMSKFIVIAAMLLLSGAAGAQVADPVRMRQTVDGYRVELVVEAILGNAMSDHRGPPVFEHRVVLTVHDPKIGSRVHVASPVLDVAERNHPGQIYPLQTIASSEGPAYEARVRMVAKGPYRIVVHATPAGVSRALKAQFEYRHHH